jgi:hypothetical protein
MAESAMSRRAQDIEADDAPAQPIQYGDLRMSTERDGGQTCLFWVRGTKSSRAGCLCTSYTPHHLRCATLAQVVPDVSPGFNVPQFYAQFVEQRKAEVSERVALVQSARGKSPKTAVPR